MFTFLFTNFLFSKHRKKNFIDLSIKFYLNGSKVGETSTGYTFSSNALDNLSFTYGSGILPFFGKTKNLKVFKRALTDAELYLLTVTQYQSYQEMATALNYTL